MSEQPVKNRPTMKKALSVPLVQIPALVKQSTVANIALAAEKVKADILNIAENIKPVADKTFVMMKNKKVWFDRNNAAIYPKFEHFTLPEFKTKGQPSKNYSADFEGFHFVGMTRREVLNSFTNFERNPYLQDDNKFRNFPNSQNRFDFVLTGDLNPGGGVWVVRSEGYVGCWNIDAIFTLVPICRLNGKDSKRVDFFEAVLLWLKNGLVPEGLSADDEREFLRIMNEYKNFFAYLDFNNDELRLAEKIDADFYNLFAEMKAAADKTFVMMKNKKVWFDRNNAAIYPKFEQFTCPKFKYGDKSSRNYTTDFEGFHFVGMTRREALNSFTEIERNPYLQDDNTFRTFSSNYNNHIFTGEAHSNGLTIYIYSDGGWSTSTSDCNATLVPICRLKGTNSGRVGFVEAVLLWLKNGLVPEGLSAELEKKYTDLMSRPNLQATIKNFSDELTRLKLPVAAITLDYDRFKRDVLAKKFTEKIADFDFNIAPLTEKVLKGEEKLIASPELLKQELLECDHKRANIQPYEDRQLTDVNKGHWELFEDSAASDSAQVQLPQGEMLVARPPQLDVRQNGICAIDFGTKSTIVVCRDGESRMLRIGQGDYTKVPTMKDFENPTVIGLRDLQNFLTAYRARIGRPFTEWNDVTVSHQAAAAIFKDNVGSSVYNSVFSELKQWAKDEQSYPVLKDLSGAIQEIKPYLSTQDIDAGDFDPIELYAYYLGLYINNMHHQIYLDYILSYPVNYKKDVRERIRTSFERGIKKSLPPALLRDEEYMKNFRVYLGASEPAAYAISALEGYGLEPKEIGQKVAYGVFDFGGGTTDFDFGIEYIPKNRRRNFIIEQFGASGDILLGGENILELLAYEVYKDNLQIMRDKKIPFALPAGCEIFAGAETLVSTTKDASSHMNNRILAEKLRPIWEHTEGRDKLTEAPLNVTLFSNEKIDGAFTVNVDVKINVEKLDKLIEDRVREGVMNFFQSLKSAFKRREVYPIHIFLAGNSCRAAVVKKLFDEFIASEDGEFILHMPLGMEDKAAEEKPADENKPDFVYRTTIDDKPVDVEFTVTADAEGNCVVEPTDEKFADATNYTVTAIAEGNWYFNAEGNCVYKLADKKTDENKPAAEKTAAEQTFDFDLDRQRTGKTGVAFGLIRCRKGGKDIQIINSNVDNSGEMIFPYYLGDAGNDGKTFTVTIGKEVEYGKWTYFTFADESEFELYYTTEPRSMQGNMPVAQVSMIHCRIDEEEMTEDENAGIYIRKVSPNEIEYAVGRSEDFKKEFKGKIYRQKL